MQTNILGTALQSCCQDPVTGFYRDGVCRTSEEDHGTHVICALITNDFLEYTKKKGNDLSTARPMYNFPGLKEGDKWCLCALRWKEAYEDGIIVKIVAESTSIVATKYISKEILLKNQI